MQLQFHHQGYRPGTPPSFATHPGTDLPPPSAPSSLPAQVDVLIIGSGAAGLVLATQLSRYPHISVAVAEQKPSRLLVGQADGIQCRSIEMFAAYGFAERVLREGYWVNETVFWKPGENGIVRSGRIRDVERGLSEFPHVILNQARILDFWLDEMKKGARGVVPTYGRRVREVSVQRAEEEKYPVTAVMEVLEDGVATGRTETVRAQYVVGCDGARSSVRKSIGIPLEGESSNTPWGVMDLLCVTDFPDIRFKSIIHSKEHGSLIIIPREGGFMVRLYIELETTGQRLDKESITAEKLIDTARAIFAPYTLEVKQIPWWSVYEVGQRMCPRFDDATDPNTHPRVFIAGDACHTHSPKAGQGMNMGMQDGHNLGWKLGSVLSGTAHPDLLRTYTAERHATASELIAFDKELTSILSGKANGANGHVDPAAFQAYFTQAGRYTAGLGYAYADSAIVAKKYSKTTQRLAAGFTVGERFHSAPVTRFWDAKPVQLGHAIAADGRWRVVVFNDASLPWEPEGRLAKMCIFLGRLVELYKRPGDDGDAVVEPLFVLQQRHEDLQTAMLEGKKQLPEQLAPPKGRFGMADFHKVFCDEEPYYHVWGSNGPWESVYDARSVSRTEGAAVVVRPDGYVAGVFDLDIHGQIFVEMFFAGFLVRPVQ